MGIWVGDRGFVFTSEAGTLTTEQELRIKQGAGTPHYCKLEDDGTPI